MQVQPPQTIYKFLWLHTIIFGVRVCNVNFYDVLSRSLTLSETDLTWLLTSLEQRRSSLNFTLWSGTRVASVTFHASFISSFFSPHREKNRCIKQKWKNGGLSKSSVRFFDFYSFFILTRQGHYYKMHGITFSRY